MQERCGESIRSSSSQVQDYPEPARLRSHRKLNAIMCACVILHNMVIEDECNIYSNPTDTASFEGLADPPVNKTRDVPEIEQPIDAYTCIKSKETNRQLQHDLIQSIWNHYGASTGPFARN
jgi:hypothetical protein